MRTAFLASALVALVVACIAPRGSEHDLCRSATTVTGGCDDGLVCQSGVCEAIHSHAAGAWCTTDDVCAEGLVCNGGRGKCEAPGRGKQGDPCSSTVHCSSGLYCFFATCGGGDKDASPPFPPLDAATEAAADAAPDGSGDAGTD